MTGGISFLEALTELLGVSDLKDVDPDANLFDLGLLDSFGIVALAELLHNHAPSTFEINMEDVENINSINKIRSLVNLELQ
jgi:acyl carrier protein